MIALKIDAKFEGKLTCAFKNGMTELVYFHRLKNSEFILESKRAELKVYIRKIPRKLSSKVVYFNVQYMYF